MRKSIYLVSLERDSQIQHGFTERYDVENNTSHPAEVGDLVDAAHFALTLKGEPALLSKHAADNIRDMAYRDRLIKAAGLLCAEIDRIENEEK